MRKKAKPDEWLMPADAVCQAIRFFPTPSRYRPNPRPETRRYPSFPRWSGVAEFTITDDRITEEVFERCVQLAGQAVGIGVFRPERGGTNGRFRIAKIEWAKS